MLLAAQPVAYEWSARLSHDDPQRRLVLRRYFLALGALEVGITREVRRGCLGEAEIILVVDEYAERLQPIRRPSLSAEDELLVRGGMFRAVQHHLMHRRDLDEP